MEKSTLQRLWRDDAPLFALVAGHLIILVVFLAALAFTELVHASHGPFSWLGYVVFHAVAGAVSIFLAVVMFHRAISGLLDLAATRLKTPDRLQRGYNRLRSQGERFEGLLRFLIAVVVALGLIGSWGVAEDEFFERVLLFWVGLYGSLIALLLLGSWLIGRDFSPPDRGAI